MKTYTLNFRRELNFKKNDKISIGYLDINHIEQINDSKWICRWRVDYLYQEGGFVYGIDPLDAFYNALYIIENLILSANKDKIDIWWKYEGDNGGFPCAIMRSDVRKELGGIS